MARRRLSMRKTKEILRLKWEAGLGLRQIARSCNLSHSTVSDYLARAKTLDLPGPYLKAWMMPHWMPFCFLATMPPATIKRTLTSTGFIGNFGVKGLLYSSCGWSIRSRIPTATSTAGFVSFTASGPRHSTHHSARYTKRERKCSSITQGRPCR